MKREITTKSNTKSMEGLVEPLEIYVGQQGDGCTYQLHPKSRIRIEQRHPKLNLAPNVFVGYTTGTEFCKIHGPLWPHIAHILTGLNEKEIREMGGIRIYDPMAEREIWRYPSNESHMVEAHPAGKEIRRR